jgi:hypothetical protein
MIDTFLLPTEQCAITIFTCDMHSYAYFTTSLDLRFSCDSRIANEDLCSSVVK